MRSTNFLVAAFAAAAFGAPLARPDVVYETDMDVVYKTVIVTATAGAVAQPSAAAAAAAAATTIVQAPAANPTPAPYQAPASPYQAPAASSAPSPYQAPAPSPTPSPYQAPSPSAIPSPSPYVQPAPPSSATPVAQAAPTSKTNNGGILGGIWGLGPWNHPKPSPAPSSYVAPAPTSTPAPVSSAAPAPAPAPTNYGSEYQRVAIMQHNAHRANHSAGELEWDDGLVQSAQAVADTCNFSHDHPQIKGNFGENLAAGISADKLGDSIQMWYDEASSYTGFYGMVNPPLDEADFSKFGHFTQLVWKGTTKIGCATKDCSSSGGLQSKGDPAIPDILTVCHYSEPGNMGGEYAENVGHCLEKPSILATFGM